MKKIGLHWFRRDLRVVGNEALAHNFKKNEGRVLGVFTFDKKFLSREDFSYNRFQFFIKTLESLREDLRERGSDLIMLDVGPEKAFTKILESSKGLVNLVTCSRDYEPFSRERDEKVQKILKRNEVEFENFRDHLLIEPNELTKPNVDEGYQVFTPFMKTWVRLFQTPEVQSRLQYQRKALSKKKTVSFDLPQACIQKFKQDDVFDSYKEENQNHVDVKIPEAGHKAAIQQLKKFSQKLNSYQEDRDYPSLEGTSQVSLFLKNGSLTVPQIIAYLDLQPFAKKKTSQDVFFSELIWREFYYHVLYRKPEVETENFNPKYKKIAWQNNRDWFHKWKEGQTGFPIVDAGMRELKTTGFMHNRVRMIVASFLTKDLLVDWRWGAQYFMEKLLDGDLAPNNGGWQWAASTGCDAQPYFRIFNPFSQSKRYDPEGVYIKKFIPELKDVESKDLHSAIIGHQSYPEPIVDHSQQRQKALSLFKNA